MNEINQNLRKNESVPLPVEINFSPEKATMLLVPDSNLINLEIKRSDARRLGLSEKSEFHLTIIGRQTGEDILDYLVNLSETEKNKILGHIRELCESIDWKVVIKNEFYYLEKTYDKSDSDGSNSTLPEKRKSIIQLAEVDQLDEFYHELNALLGKQFETPLPHITLYAASTREDKNLRGIGIYSEKQFKELNPKKI